MKRIMLSMLLLAALHSDAQVTSKKFYVSGYGNFSHQRDFNITFMELSPTFGYVLADKVVTGITLPFTHFKDDNIYKSNLFGVGPMVRYYMGNSKLKIFPHVEFTYNFVKVTTNTIVGDVITKDQQASGMGALGVSYFVGEQAALELMAGYQIKDRNYFDYNTFKIQFGISVFFGGE